MSVILAAPHTIEGARKIALLMVDQKAEEVRLRYLTSGDGQTQVYLEKADEASDYISAGGPLADLENYPYIRVEAEVTGKPPLTVANDIINARANWVTVSAAIEKVRLKSKQRIRKDKTASEIMTGGRKAVEDLDQL